ncbi:hypothetical protein Angca_001965, partial [Angiostrongylus cantonensis]
GLAHHVSFHVHEEDHDRLHLTKPPAVILRSLSKSDPHLSIPHLLMSQDEDHPSLNRIVSGLFHVGSALRTPNTSCGNLEVLMLTVTSVYMKNIFHLILMKFVVLRSFQSTPLRKSSSATDWSGVVAEVTRKNSKVSFLTGYAVAVISVIVMSNSDDHHQNSSVVATHLLNDSHCSEGFVASGSSSVHPLSTGSPNGHDNSTNQSHSVFGKMFHRGFFSKPVMRSEEESYRYLMALDR